MAYPNWISPGGYSRLLVWRPDTGASVSTHAVAPPSYEADEETRLLGDGTLDVVSRTRPLSLLVADWAAVRRLRRWRDDGARVRARLLAPDGGQSLLWDEEVPVLLRSVNGGRGALAGDVLTLHTALYDAAVVQSPDLLALHTFASGGDWATGGTVSWAVDADGETYATVSVTSGTSYVRADVALPAPGARVRFGVDVPTSTGGYQTSLSSLVLAESPGEPPSLVLGSFLASSAGESVEATVPAGAFGVRAEFSVSSAGISESAQVRLPVLTLA